MALIDFELVVAGSLQRDRWLRFGEGPTCCVTLRLFKVTSGDRGEVALRMAPCCDTISLI